MSEPRSGSTAAQLRDDIDAGRTGDKIAWPDPATAPLGTDEEAGGTPPTPQEVSRARVAERGRRAASGGSAKRNSGRWIALAALVLVVAVAVAVLMVHFA